MAGVSVGWLHGTVPVDASTESSLGTNDVAQAALALLGHHLPGPTTLMDRGMLHYAKGISQDAKQYSVGYSGMGGASGTVLVTVKQRGWEALDDPQGLLAALDGLGLRSSRLDLAGDATVAPRRPHEYFECRESAWTRTRRGEWVLTCKGDGGETLFIGSRSSARFGRIYVKGPEWVRHELELKGALASSSVRELLGGEALSAVWAREYARLVRWRH